MPKYLGSRAKRIRRVDDDLELFAVRSADSKCKRKTGPGQHGAKRGRSSDYGVLLTEKQSLRFRYGVLERQFRNYYREAARRKGPTGEILLQLLECRLDNVVYRMGFGSTRAEARQLITHRAILVNGRIVDKPSFQVKPGDVVEVKEKSKAQARIKAALELAQQRPIPEWMQIDVQSMKGTFVSVPARDQMSAGINELRIVELYSK